MITGAILDFDGTLFDSMHIWKTVKMDFLIDLGLEITEADRDYFAGHLHPEVLRMARERFGLRESFEELRTMFFDYLRKHYMEKAAPKRDILSFLELLREKGIPNLWIPKEENFICIEALPMLGSGKLDLSNLAKLAKSHAGDE